MIMDYDTKTQNNGYTILIQRSILAALAAFLLWKLSTYLQSPLRIFPGPFLAKWTDLWRLYTVCRGDSHIVVRGLHQRYGPVVRIGPNMLDIDEPSLIKTLYNIKDDFVKVTSLHSFV